ncbi:MAG: hypothetical protein AVDCRST_MAG33-2235 [uncultured Thermomicrobiales bacterium]|uniref:Uncharacterized protein n=1 Tax=uncultured Thermomicrobiales bacterium TaxID=1645740 RepID=A0A6J4V4K7_9BACT|nr:MAG: hypothetical protein AVDCRST_MAG33-2235 [uncultured Thermomicrobiales bacterium]
MRPRELAMTGSCDLHQIFTGIAIAHRCAVCPGCQSCSTGPMGGG